MPDRTLSSLHQSKTLKIDRLTVKVYNSPTELSEDAVWLAVKYLRSLLNVKETVSIILATGNSQLQFLDRLTSSKDLDWSRIIFYHLDEYLGIDGYHPGSFRYYLQEKVCQKIDPRQFHFIEGDAIEPLAECQRYSKLLSPPEIDLCLLGIGDNGHLAFNEPRVANVNDPEVIKLVKLEDLTRQQQVNGGYFPDLQTVPQYAYTLTIPTICQAKKIFCLAPGKHKAEVIRKTLELPINEDFPATILRDLERAILFCDRNSFALWRN